MRIAVMSASDFGKEISKLFFAQPSIYETVTIIEKDYKKLGYFNKIPIISFDMAVKDYWQKIIDKFVIPSLEEITNKGMYEALTKAGVRVEDILYAPVLIAHSKELTTLARINMICKFNEREELGTIEIHAADHCNLNCKNCSMFCGLVREARYPNYEKAKAGLLKLRRFFNHIKKVRIIGGEPFLNPDLNKFIDLVRTIYPWTDIRLITNGILIKTMTEELKETLRRNLVTLVITQYPPLTSKMDEIHTFLANDNIQHEITDVVKCFQKIYDLSGKQNVGVSHKACHWKGECATIFEDKIAPCFVPFVLPFAAAYFSLPISLSGIIDLNEEGLTPQVIHKRMEEPFDLCKYCAADHKMVPWEITDYKAKQMISDWSI